MAKKPAQKGEDNEVDFQFEDLDGDFDDGIPPDEPNPRANDPFVVDDDDEPAPKKKEGEDDEPYRIAEDDEDEDDDDGRRRKPKADDDDDDDDEVERLRLRLAELERTGGAASSELAEARKELAEQKVKEIDTEITKITETDLAAAIEDGDAKKQAQLTAKIAGLEADKRVAQHAQATPQRQATGGDGQYRYIRPHSERAKAWAAKHPWVNDERYETENHALLGIVRSLYEAEGIDDRINPEAFYGEVERRLKRRFPNLFPKGGNRTMGDQRRRSTVAPVSRDDPPARRPGTNGGKVVLTREDLSNMKLFGLNPRDPQVLREYAKHAKRDDETARRR